MEKFDRVYIGTGPISVADACHFASDDRNVLLVDDKARAGGAWVAIPIGEYGELEIGCHIWSYNKAVYDFLERFFELDLIELKPQPYFLRGNVKLGYDQKHAVTTLKSFGKRLSKGQVKSAFNYIRKDPSARIPIIPKKNLYPRGGARDIQQSIERKIETHRLITRLNSAVKSLRKIKENWELTFDNGDQLLTKEVVMTATSAIEEIEVDGQITNIEHTPIQYAHYHVVVKGKPKKPCSYVRVLNHDYIHRVSEITYQLEQNNKEDLTVYIVGVFDHKLPSNKSEIEIANDLLTYLTDRGFTTQENTLLYQQKNRFETTYISGHQRALVNAMPGLELMATTDLIYGFYYQLEKWFKA